MKQTVFLSLVLASVLELKANATDVEKARLNFSTVEPAKRDGCILAQMTASKSISERANELAKKTIGVDRKLAEKLKEKGKGGAKLTKTFSSKNDYWSKDIIKAFVENDLDVIGDELSAPFETFILIEGANTEELIAFVKGEREDFKPKFK